ncbi:MAG: tetratricopeptide repeat protein [Acidobacteriota bacterium]
MAATSAVVVNSYLSRKTQAAIQSIAVMPFVNESGNAEVDYLSDGMTETLIGSLSQIPNLNVKARSSVFRYKGKETDAQTIGKELNVQAILNGRVVQRGEDLVVYLELVNTQTGNRIWGDQYNKTLANLVSLQSEIARDVSQKLELRLSGADERRVAKNYTANTEAYQLYLKGRFYWNKRTGEGVTKSVEYFEKALKQDPGYALAFAGLADAYSVMPSYADGAPDVFFPKAKAAARRALELDESLAEAHTALARVLFAYDWSFAESDREYQRAIALNPNYATAHHWYGNANLLRTGRFEESIAEMKHAQMLDPLSLIINADLGENYLLARRYDEAIAQLVKTIEMDERFYYAHWQLGIAYQMKGSYPEAIAEYTRARQLSDNQWMLALLGQAYAVSGNKSDAYKLLAQLKELSRQRYIQPYSFAIIYVGLNDKDQAFQSLEESYQNRGQELTRLKVDPFLDPLRSDPRFQNLLRRVGLPN